MLRSSIVLSGLLALSGVAFIGCGQSEPQAPPEAGTAPTTVDSQGNDHAGPGHEHAPGAHGGTIVPIGRENYHAEIVFEEGGLIRLFMLGADESMIHEVDVQTLTAFVKAHGTSNAVSVEFQSEPQSDDAEGKTSQFVGQLPEQLVEQDVDVTITSIRIDGDRFRLGFSSPENHEEHAPHELPEKTTDAEERELYLTAAGKYTEADIAANGNQTASQKFRGIAAAHDLKPKPGDKICPITLTKANPEFTWIVDGKAYEFCCPPCVDELVRLAKENPSEVREPESYVKQ